MGLLGAVGLRLTYGEVKAALARCRFTAILLLNFALIPALAVVIVKAFALEGDVIIAMGTRRVVALGILAALFSGWCITCRKRLPKEKASADPRDSVPVYRSSHFRPRMQCITSSAATTAKVAGTEMGVTEPQATFSPCFGGPFLVWHPSKYAELLAEKMRTHKARVWLVNTGWGGGAYFRLMRFPVPVAARQTRRR